MDPEEIGSLSDTTLTDDAPDPQTPEEELDAWGNPAGTEYEVDGVLTDGDGNPLPEVPVAEARPEEPTEEAKPTETELPKYTPPPPTLQYPSLQAHAQAMNSFTEEERTYLNDLLLTDPLQAQVLIQGRMQAIAEAGRTANDYYVGTVAKEIPEFVNVHRDAMNAWLSNIPPQNRFTEDATYQAIAAALYQEMRTTKDIKGALRRAGILAGGNPQPQPKPKDPPKPLAPSQRVPSATVSAGGAGRQVSRGMSGDVKTYMELFGVSQDEAQRIVNLQKRS